MDQICAPSIPKIEDIQGKSVPLEQSEVFILVKGHLNAFLVVALFRKRTFKKRISVSQEKSLFLRNGLICNR